MNEWMNENRKQYNVPRIIQLIDLIVFIYPYNNVSVYQ